MVRQIDRRMRGFLNEMTNIDFAGGFFWGGDRMFIFSVTIRRQSDIINPGTLPANFHVTHTKTSRAAEPKHPRPPFTFKTGGTPYVLE